MERLPGKKNPASLLWSWLDTHVQAIAHPSRGMKLTQPRQQRYACAAPKTFVVPFSFQSSFTQQASFFSPGPCFHFTANTIWFGFHDIPAQRRSHSAGAPARRRRHRRIHYTESKRIGTPPLRAHASPKNNKSLIKCLKRPIHHMHSGALGSILFVYFSVKEAANVG